MRPTLIALLLAVLATACTSIAGAEQQPVATFAEADRVALPEIAGPTISGGRLALADLEGPVLVNFWASWCGPCKSEAPHLNAIAQQYDGRLTVLGINTRDPDLVNAQTFARANGLTFPSLFDPDQAAAAAFGGRGPVGMPTTLLLDAEHRVAVRFYGAVAARDVVPFLSEIGVES